MRQAMWWLFLCTAACSAVVSACTSSELVYRSINGTYTLRTVNGTPLPYTVSSGAAAGSVIIEDVITLFEGGTFTRPMTLQPSSAGPIERRTETGNHTLFRSSLSLRTNETGKTHVATLNGTTLTLVEAGMTSVYRK